MCLQSKYEETIKESTKALEINPAYTKALMRRAEAYEKRENFEEAIAGALTCFRAWKSFDLFVW